MGDLSRESEDLDVGMRDGLSGNPIIIIVKVQW